MIETLYLPSQYGYTLVFPRGLLVISCKYDSLIYSINEINTITAKSKSTSWCVCVLKSE